MAVSIYVLFAVVSIVIIYWKNIYDTLKRRKRICDLMADLPGPFAIPLLGTTWQFKWKMSELTKQLSDWGAYYGDQGHSMIKIWLGPNPLIFIIRPEAAKVVLESNELITKGPEYDILVPWLGTGLLIATGDKWRHRRKLLTPSFHFKVLTDFVAVHDHQSKIFTEQLEIFADNNEEFDIFPFVKRAALDIICETAMGCTVSAQTNHSHPYVVAVQQMNELSFKWQRMPWLQLKPIWYLSGAGGEYDRNLKIVSDFTKKVIAEKLEEPSIEKGGRKAFLDMLIELSRNGELAYEDIREEVDTFMFEGHDTTAASMGWTIWCMAFNPDCQKKVQDELHQIFGESDRECTTDDLKQMKYLEWCIKESLRLRPSVPNFTRISEKDFDINGTVVPEGVSIVVAPMMLHKNATLYDDPQKFDPSRFSEERSKGRNPYAYVPFSAGPRNCIGQKFALMEEKTMISWFFRRFSVSSSRDFDSNLPMPEIILRPSIGFPVSIKRRKS